MTNRKVKKEEEQTNKNANPQGKQLATTRAVTQKQNKETNEEQQQDDTRTTTPTTTTITNAKKNNNKSNTNERTSITAPSFERSKIKQTTNKDNDNTCDYSLLVPT